MEMCGAGRPGTLMLLTEDVYFVGLELGISMAGVTGEFVREGNKMVADPSLQTLEGVNAIFCSIFAIFAFSCTDTLRIKT